MQYRGYTVEDFVIDPYFQEWVQNPTEQADAFWENWLLTHPSQAGTVAEARAVIQAMNFEPRPMPAARAEAIWHTLEKTVLAGPGIHKAATHGSKPRWIYPVSRPVFVSIAASLAAILFLATAFFLYSRWGDRVIHTTAYGETKKIHLPDGSVVVLNANSEISFAGKWSAEATREVWLSGEAFFSVMHTANHQKFIVHTDDFLQVEVLGTEFNITKRNNKTRVVLETGKIQLNIQPANKKDTPGQRLLMKPGELVEFDESSEKYIKKEVNPEIYSSWRSNKLMLDETSLQEIIQFLENTYGYQVKVTQQHLLAQKVSGSIPLGHKDTLLQYIAQTFEVKISRQGNIVQINPAKE
jgi:transmembrane sensor